MVLTLTIPAGGDKLQDMPGYDTYIKLGDFPYAHALTRLAVYAARHADYPYSGATPTIADLRAHNIGRSAGATSTSTYPALFTLTLAPPYNVANTVSLWAAVPHAGFTDFNASIADSNAATTFWLYDSGDDVVTKLTTSGGDANDAFTFQLDVLPGELQDHWGASVSNGDKVFFYAGAQTDPVAVATATLTATASDLTVAVMEDVSDGELPVGCSSTIVQSEEDVTKAVVTILYNTSALGGTPITAAKGNEVVINIMDASDVTIASYTVTLVALPTPVLAVDDVVTSVVANGADVQVATYSVERSSYDGTVIPVGVSTDAEAFSFNADGTITYATSATGAATINYPDIVLTGFGGQTFAASQSGAFFATTLPEVTITYVAEYFDVGNAPAGLSYVDEGTTYTIPASSDVAFTVATLAYDAADYGVSASFNDGGYVNVIGDDDTNGKVRGSGTSLLFKFANITFDAEGSDASFGYAVVPESEVLVTFANGVQYNYTRTAFTLRQPKLTLNSTDYLDGSGNTVSTAGTDPLALAKIAYGGTVKTSENRVVLTTEANAAYRRAVPGSELLLRLTNYGALTDVTDTYDFTNGTATFSFPANGLAFQLQDSSSFWAVNTTALDFHFSQPSSGNFSAGELGTHFGVDAVGGAQTIVGYIASGVSNVVLTATPDDGNTFTYNADTGAISFVSTTLLGDETEYDVNVSYDIGDYTFAGSSFTVTVHPPVVTFTPEAVRRFPAAAHTFLVGTLYVTQYGGSATAITGAAIDAQDSGRVTFEFGSTPETTGLLSTTLTTADATPGTYNIASSALKYPAGGSSLTDFYSATTGTSFTVYAPVQLTGLTLKTGADATRYTLTVGEETVYTAYTSTSAADMRSVVTYTGGNADDTYTVTWSVLKIAPADGYFGVNANDAVAEASMGTASDTDLLVNLNLESQFVPSEDITDIDAAATGGSTAFAEYEVAVTIENANGSNPWAEVEGTSSAALRLRVYADLQNISPSAIAVPLHHSTSASVVPPANLYKGGIVTAGASYGLSVATGGTTRLEVATADGFRRLEVNTDVSSPSVDDPITITVTDLASTAVDHEDVTVTYYGTPVATLNGTSLLPYTDWDNESAPTLVVHTVVEDTTSVAGILFATLDSGNLSFDSTTPSVQTLVLQSNYGSTTTPDSTTWKAYDITDRDTDFDVGFTQAHDEFGAKFVADAVAVVADGRYYVEIPNPAPDLSGVFDALVQGPGSAPATNVYFRLWFVHSLRLTLTPNPARNAYDPETTVITNYVPDAGAVDGEHDYSSSLTPVTIGGVSVPQPRLSVYNTSADADHQLLRIAAPDWTDFRVLSIVPTTSTYPETSGTFPDVYQAEHNPSYLSSDILFMAVNAEGTVRYGAQLWYTRAEDSWWLLDTGFVWRLLANGLEDVRAIVIASDLSTTAYARIVFTTYQTDGDSRLTQPENLGNDWPYNSTQLLSTAVHGFSLRAVGHPVVALNSADVPVLSRSPRLPDSLRLTMSAGGGAHAVDVTDDVATYDYSLEASPDSGSTWYVVHSGTTETGLDTKNTLTAITLPERALVGASDGQGGYELTAAWSGPTALLQYRLGMQTTFGVAAGYDLVYSSTLSVASWRVGDVDDQLRDFHRPSSDLTLRLCQSDDDAQTTTANAYSEYGVTKVNAVSGGTTLTWHYFEESA